MSFLKALALLVLAASPSFGDDRPADKILADINAVEFPKPPGGRVDAEAMRAYSAANRQALERQAELIGELYKSHPESPELIKWIGGRWALASTPGPKGEAIKAEMEDVLANGKDEKLVAEAAFTKAFISIPGRVGQQADAVAMLAAIDDFVKRFPQDKRGLNLLSTAAARTTDPARKAEIEGRIEKNYPNSPAAAYMAGHRRQRESIGKPFDLTFTDATKGTEVSMASLKGKVVVVDFWATWCGPCVAEMPKMKKLYAEYKDKGVEFVGVSLDQPEDKGGLKRLKDYVAKNEIGWPQYYQGNFWQSEFSMSWGINSIPCVFLIDAEGNLASTAARGKLETLIPEYLEKAKAKKTAAR